MDLKTFTSAVMEIAQERGIPQERVIEVIEAALASAYKKQYGKKHKSFGMDINHERIELLNLGYKNKFSVRIFGLMNQASTVK